MDFVLNIMNFDPVLEGLDDRTAGGYGGKLPVCTSRSPLRFLLYLLHFNSTFLQLPHFSPFHSSIFAPFHSTCALNFVIF